MPIWKVSLYKCLCLQCNHEWTTRKPEPPDQCPKCHSVNWNKQKGGDNEPQHKGSEKTDK